MKLLAKDLAFVNKSSIINRINSDISKVGRTKSKNTIMPDFLAKSKLFIKLSFGLSFLAFKTRLAFAKLKKVFIKVPTLHYFDLEYYIYVETNALANIISGVFSQFIWTTWADGTQ